MIGLCDVCGKRLARFYDDDLELRMCGECRASYVHGDEYVEGALHGSEGIRRRSASVLQHLPRVRCHDTVRVPLL